jgi:hypothetical protein
MAKCSSWNHGGGCRHGIPAVFRSFCHYQRQASAINSEMKKLGYDVHWQTVRRVMLNHGLLGEWQDFIDHGVDLPMLLAGLR